MRNKARRRHAAGYGLLAAVAGCLLLPACRKERPVPPPAPEARQTVPIRPFPILPPPAPAVYWTMDSIVDGALPDVAGLHHAAIPGLTGMKDVRFGGVLPGFTPTTAPGVKGQALALVRDQQGFLRVAAPGQFDVTQGMTVSAWVKINGGSALMNILSCAEDLPNPKGGWTLCYSYGTVIFRAVDAAGKLQTLASPKDSVPAGAWVHIAAVAEAATLRLYLNGVEAASIPFAGPIRMAANPLVIGNHAGIAGWRHSECPAFGGLMDEVKIFQKPLSAAEIMAESELALAPIQ
jgi:hypothetical protein